MTDLSTTLSVEHHTVEIEGVRVHYTRAGSGPAVMLLHGWPQTWYEWRHVMADLAADHTVIAPDLRGCGLSGKPIVGYDGNSVARDLTGLADHLGWGDFVVVGHDWGAVFGYCLAAQNRERVRGLGVFEMLMPGIGFMEPAMVPRPGGNYLWHMGFQSVPDIPELLIAGKEEQYLRYFFERYAYDPSAIGAADLDEYVDAITQAGALRSGLAIYQQFFKTGEQVAEHAREPLAIPVVAYGGVASAADATLASVRVLAPDATGGVIDRCGHWASEERPDYVAKAVRDLVVEAGVRS